MELYLEFPEDETPENPMMPKPAAIILDDDDEDSDEEEDSNEEEDSDEDEDHSEEDEDPRTILFNFRRFEDHTLEEELINPLAIAEYEKDKDHAEAGIVHGKLAIHMLKNVVPRLTEVQIACRRAPSTTPGKIYAICDGAEREKNIRKWIKGLRDLPAKEIAKCARAIRVSFRKEFYLFKEDVEDREKIYEKMVQQQKRFGWGMEYIPGHPLIPKQQHLKKMPRATTKRQRK